MKRRDGYEFPETVSDEKRARELKKGITLSKTNSSPQKNGGFQYVSPFPEV